jgi:hypothetical protein
MRCEKGNPKFLSVHTTSHKNVTLSTFNSYISDLYGNNPTKGRETDVGQPLECILRPEKQFPHAQARPL